MVKKTKRVQRIFTEEVRKQIIRSIENNELSPTGASREYQVSLASIYVWMNRYSVHLKNGNRFIVEKKSQTERVRLLQERIAALERSLGQKQLENDILQKTIEFGSEEAGFDLKKKFAGKSSSGTKSAKKSTPTN